MPAPIITAAIIAAATAAGKTLAKEGARAVRIAAQRVRERRRRRREAADRGESEADRGESEADRGESEGQRAPWERRQPVSECPPGTHATLDDALACGRCQAASREAREAEAADLARYAHARRWWREEL